MTLYPYGPARLGLLPTQGEEGLPWLRVTLNNGTTARAPDVRPVDVRSETYEYYSLPYCQPKDGVKHKLLGMGEVVDANRMASTPYELQFRKNRQREVVCEQSLDGDRLAKFRKV